MPARLRPLSAPAIAEVLQRLDSASAAGGDRSSDDERAAVKHFLALLATRHPGKSVEVRVPPYAAIQCVEGARHTRGTPPAVVETDPRTWIDLARGTVSFVDARDAGRIRASGERSDLSSLLPLL
ncbi:MAG TPA: sterol carrier family protein [Nocardioidaceae bacterium]|nr:sterol carrier family protein [Nocardioidaceae bacterium]